ncbi:MAG: permease [Solirubrobacteraceae bacterium]
MSSALEVLWHALRDSLLMVWAVWWALVLGFAISAVVQAWVPRERVERSLAGSGARPVALATGLGAASSSCSYAAIAIARSLFEKGASSATALAFQFASTNLVWELGLVLWVLIGWQFTLAEYLGGIVMIALMALLLRLFVPARLEARAREHARSAGAVGHHHHHDHASGGSERNWSERLSSRAAWSEVALNFSGDWRVLYREIAVGFLLAGFVAQLGNSFFEGLFVVHAPAPLPAIESALVGPLIAVLSFVCSIGNVPLAAVLWSGGIGFAGVIAFLFADLLVLPIIAAYRKFYGSAYTLRTVALMYCTMVLAALAVAALFSALGLVPTGPRPSRAHVFGTVALDYKLVLNLLALVLFMALEWLSRSAGVAAGGTPEPKRVASAATAPPAAMNDE